MSVAAGWFPDPAGVRPRYRWWDGNGWTRWLTDDLEATPPGPEPISHPTGTAGPVPQTPSGVGTKAAEGRSITIPLALAMVLGVVVLALAVVGLTVTLTEDRIRSGPAVAPPSAAPAPGLVLDPSTRTVRIENVSLVLPATPYVCARSAASLLPSLSSAISCDAPIHRDYRGTADWSASSGLGLIADSLVAKDDLDRTGRNLYASFRRQFFTGERTTLQKFQRVQNSVQGLFFTGEVRYSITGLSSTYDRLVVGVIELPSGRYAAFFSSRPNDTPAATLAALNRSIATLSAR